MSDIEAQSVLETSELKGVVLVAGMHRSGTSAAARFINLFGADLPADLVPPAESNNPLGFWEPKRMVDINNSLLADLRMMWHSVGPMPNQWWLRREVQDRRAEAEEFLDTLTGRCAVLKDSYLSRHFLFWQSLITSMESSIHVAVPYRHSLEFGLALAERDRFAMGNRTLLWPRCKLDAKLTAREAATRHFAPFDDPLSMLQSIYQKCLARLGHFISRHWEVLANEVTVCLNAPKLDFFSCSEVETTVADEDGRKSVLDGRPDRRWRVVPNSLRRRCRYRQSECVESPTASRFRVRFGQRCQRAADNAPRHLGAFRSSRSVAQLLCVVTTIQLISARSPGHPDLGLKSCTQRFPIGCFSLKLLAVWNGGQISANYRRDIARINRIQAAP